MSQHSQIATDQQTTATTPTVATMLCMAAPRRQLAPDAALHVSNDILPMNSNPPCTWLLRHSDQSAVAIFILLVLAASVGWSIAENGRLRHLVEADNDAQEYLARFQVDINAADHFELIQLPGIGETLAQRIIETRQSVGPFIDVDDLRRVRGIGPKILDRLRPYLLPIPNGEEKMNNDSSSKFE